MSFSTKTMVKVVGTSLILLLLLIPTLYGCVLEHEQTPLDEVLPSPSATASGTPLPSETTAPTDHSPTPTFVRLSTATELISLQNRTVPAFPGAEGFGASTSGGRGGYVIYVTNTDPDPYGTTTGSFNWALRQEGARYILFKVSGVIHATANIVHGNVTIAGQTSPGGIIVRGLVCDGHYDRNNCDNLIVRHIRSRLALDTVPAPPGVEIIEDTLRMDGVRNFIIDHSSFARSADEVAQISWASYGTLQNNIFAETTGDHYEYGGMLLNYSHTEHPQDYLSIHHNMWNRIYGRLPEITCAVSGYPNAPEEFVDCQRHPLHLELSNNLYWDPGFLIWYNRFIDIDEKLNHGAYRIALNMVNNFMVVRSTFNYPLMVHDFLDEGSNELYLSGNRVNRYPGYSDFQLANCCQSFSPPDTEPGVAVRRTTRHEYPLITYTNTEDMVAYAINNIGAFPRDPMDRRLLLPLQTNKIDLTAHNLPAAQDMFSLDFDADNPPLAPQDSDADGMPDEFETLYGLNPNFQDHNGSQLSILFTGVSGYTNLECYLNWLSDQLIT